jgi:hypothetical protein
MGVGWHLAARYKGPISNKLWELELEMKDLAVLMEYSPFWSPRDVYLCLWMQSLVFAMFWELAGFLFEWGRGAGGCCVRRYDGVHKNDQGTGKQWRNLMQ